MTGSMAMPLTSALLSTIKNAAHVALLRSPTSRILHERFSSIRVTAQLKPWWMENIWWARLAAQIQSYANINDAKTFMKH